MSKIEREFAYRPSGAPRLLGYLMLVMAPLMAYSLSQPTTSDVQMRIRGFGLITLTPAQQPIAGWIFALVLVLLGLFFLRLTRPRVPSKLTFTQTAFIMTAPTFSGGEVSILFREIRGFTRSGEGRRSRVRFDSPYGQIEIPCSQMESPAAFEEMAALLAQRVKSPPQLDPASTVAARDAAGG